MHQVFVNLLLNAAEASKDNGVINIRSRMVPTLGRIRVEIADNGCGIAPEHLTKVFEPFFTTKPKGTGLGMAVTYRIIRNHQGKIQVSSQPGEGTRFTIEIPLHRDASPTETKGQADGTQ
jgi:signal transduction histidine kinase